MNNSLGERIKQLRIQANLSQEKLCILTGVSRSNISKIESNSISPTAKSVASFASFFRVTSDFLLFGSDEHQKPNEEHQNLKDNKLLDSEEKEILKLWNELSYMNKTIIKGEMYKLKKEESKKDFSYHVENLMVAE